MSLYIESEEVAALARRLAARTGLSVPEAVSMALRAQLQPAGKTRESSDFAEFWREVQALQRRSADRPLRDFRDHDEMLYDANGLPK